MPARISEVCAGVLDMLAGIFNPQPPDSAETGYAPTDVLELLDGKRVRVFPAAYGDAERLARRRVMKEYKVAVLVEVPYLAAASAAPGETIPPEWVDDQIAWVEANVFDPLNVNFTHAEDGLLLDSLTCWSCAVTTVYDALRLAEEKLLVSVVEVAYRESAEG